MPGTSKPKPLRKGIYLLPNLFTVGALFAGFYAIVAATKNQFDVAAIAIFVAMLLDALDGRIARLTHTQTEFGAQMDSLSDMVCFGVTPALVLYIWSLSTLGKPGWLAAFIYMACSALRLARFNSQSQSENKRYFQGLSTTATAGVIAGVIWTAVTFKLSGHMMALGVLVMTVVLAFLKVSTIRYRSFKDLDIRGKVPFMAVIAIALLFVLISFDPPMVFFTVFALYAISGPLETVWKIRQRRRDKKKKSQSKESK